MMPIRATPFCSAQNGLAGTVFWRMQPTGENSIGQNTEVEAENGWFQPA